MEFSLCAALFFQTVATLASLASSYLSSRRLLGSAWEPSSPDHSPPQHPYTVAWKLSPGSKLDNGRAHLFLISWQSLSCAACCLVYETLFIFSGVFVCYVITAKRVNQSLLIHLGQKHKSVSTFSSQEKEDT